MQDAEARLLSDKTRSKRRARSDGAGGECDVTEGTLDGRMEGDCSKVYQRKRCCDATEGAKRRYV